MKRKLKNMLKNTYGSKMPNRKYSFIQELKNNPAWRKLHPISSVVQISSAIKIILTSAIAVFTGITAFNSIRNSNDTEPPAPYIPPVITESTNTHDTTYTYVTTSASYTTSTLTSCDTSSVKNTSSNTSYITTSSHSTTTTTKTALSNEYTEKFTTEINFAETTAEITTSTTATEIYYTHLFRHDYSIEEIQENEHLLYGYPDNDVANQLFADYNADYLSMSITFTDSVIIEGEITAVEYTSYEGKPWTICNVCVNEVFDFYYDDVVNNGDIVRIAVAGGYMALSEYIELNPDDKTFSEWSPEKINSTTIYEDGGNSVKPQTGDSRLFILNQDKLNLNGTEVRTCLAYSDLFQLYRDGEYYVSFNAVSDGRITYNKLYELTHEGDCYIHEPDGSRCLLIKNESFLFTGRQTYYSVNPDGYITYLGETSTDNGFFPYNSDDNYSVSWTDKEVIIEYFLENGIDTKKVTLTYNIIDNSE